MTRVSMIPETAKIPFHKLSLKLTAVLVEEDDGGGGSVIEFNQNGFGFGSNQNVRDPASLDQVLSVCYCV